MSIKAFGDSVFIEPESIVRHSGLIVLPEDNSIEKISPCARVIDKGEKCKGDFKIGDRVIIQRFFDKPFYIEKGEKRLRVIREHYIHAVISDDLRIEAFRRVR